MPELYSNLLASPMEVGNPQECVFYHSLDLPVSGYQKGHWDLRGKFKSYTSNVSFQNKTVLDVGTASGFLSFEAEKHGAKSVVSVDAESATHWDRLPFIQNQAMKDRAGWEVTANQYLDSIKRSYWLAHKEFRSQNLVYYGNAYALPEGLGQFDIVIVGQILVHLSDTLRALASIANRCKNTLIIAEGMTHEQYPVSNLLGRAKYPEQDYTFWHHSEGFYNEVLQMLGFKRVSSSAQKYICNLQGPKEGVEITTLVFERVMN